MRVLSHYVARSIAASCLVVLVAFVALDLIFRMLEEVDNIEGNYTMMKVVVYELLRTPSRLYDIMPVVGLIGCLAGLGGLANSSELVVMRSAGVSTLRLVWLSVKPTLAFLFLAMLVGEFVAPKTEQMAVAYRSLARNLTQDINVTRGLWLRDKESFVFVNAVQPTGLIYGVSIFSFDEDNHLRNIRQADRASYDGKGWSLEHVTITDFSYQEGGVEEISSLKTQHMEWESELTPELLTIAALEPKDLPIQSLKPYIQFLQGQALNSDEYELAFWKKAFYPLVMISLVLVGVSFVFGPLRQVTMGYRVFLGVMIGILFRTLQDTLGPMSIVFGFSPLLAMLLPVLLCSVVGLVLLARVR